MTSKPSIFASAAEKWAQMRFAVEKTQNDVTSGYQTYVTSKISTQGLFEEHDSSEEGQKKNINNDMYTTI